MPIAETFTFVDDDGTSLSDVARLDTMVTVVDAFNFLRDSARPTRSPNAALQQAKRTTARWSNC